MIQEAINRIIDQKKLWIEGFNGKDYPNTFEAFIEECKPLLQDLPEDTDEQSELAKHWVTVLDEMIQNAGLFKRSSFKEDIKQILVVYMIPTLLISEVEKEKSFCEMLCSYWNENHPKDQLQAADYSEILKGFKDTVFGFDVGGILQKRNKS